MKYSIKGIFRATENKVPSIRKYEEPADFETAIRAVGFGKFNILLIIAAIPMCWSSIFETTTMSYVFPAAQCDLNLTLEDKGMLNAITYAGTITSAFVWGFLFDTMGRKRLLVIGFLFDGLFVVLSGFSQNFTFLMVMKFFGGFIMNGPYAALTTYLSELHSEEQRSRVPLITGLWNALGCIYLPLLASIVLPMSFEIVLADYIVLHSWSLFLLLNAIPGLLSGTIFLFLPESPKFLMSIGKNEEALKVFRRIYSINTGKTVDTYPIKKLVEEKVKDVDDTIAPAETYNGCGQIRPLFSSPLLEILIMVCLLQVFLTMSLNTLRLWMPQLFQAINDYKFLNNGTSSSLCEMLSLLGPKEDTSRVECFVNFDNFEVYMNSISVAASTAFFYIMTGTIVNLFQQKKILASVSVISGISASAIYFSQSSVAVTVFVAGFVSFASIGSNVILIIAVNLFPTSLRTMTVSLVMMSGRAAAMIGNILFPYILETNCGLPFFSIAALTFASCMLSLFLPKKNRNFI